jgi:hypothetical protein
MATAAKEDIRQIGNYPDFPAVSSQVKSPHGFWDPQDRRNFGDKVPLHVYEVSVQGPFPFSCAQKTCADARKR